MRGIKVFSPSPTDPLPLIDLPLLPAGLTFITDPTPLFDWFPMWPILPLCLFLHSWLFSDWWLSLQPPGHAGSLLADLFTLKMDAIRFSETSVNARSTQRHIPEDEILHSHRSENFKSYNLFNSLIRVTIMVLTVFLQLNLKGTSVNLSKTSPQTSSKHTYW
jgi:hypothetical protein